MTPVVRNLIIASTISIAALTGEAEDAQSRGTLMFGAGLKNCVEFVQAVDAERRTKPPNAPPGVAYTGLYAVFLNFLNGFCPAQIGPFQPGG